MKQHRALSQAWHSPALSNSVIMFPRLFHRLFHTFKPTNIYTKAYSTNKALHKCTLLASSLAAAIVYSANNNTNNNIEISHKENSIPSKALSELQLILPAERISLDEEDLLVHSSDISSYHQGPCTSAVLYPLTTEEVSKIMKISNEYNIPIIAYGSGTSLEGHTCVAEGGITLDLSKMNNIITVNNHDMDCTVEPGISWNQLNKELEEFHLFFPVDPGPGASIGGMVGTNCSGTNAVRYGTMKWNVINLTVVLADGTIVKTANRARKSSAGYDLTRLFVGSEGTLGIITEITLRLQNVPESTAVAVTQFDSIHSAASAAIEIQRKGIQMGCIELLDEECIRVVNDYSNLNYSLAPSIFFKFTGTQQAVQDNIRQVQSILAKYNTSEFKYSSDVEEREKIWEGRKGALWATMASDPTRSVWTTDVCVPISRLAEAIELTQRDIKQTKLVAPIVGHVGDGNYHVLILIDRNNAQELAEAKQLNDLMIRRAIEMEGTCTGEHGVGIGKIEYLEAELGCNTVQLMRTIKGSLDPKNLLNPGKIFQHHRIIHSPSDKNSCC
jgi:D-lactate dehydrogenase (cytochrome)